MMFLVLSLLLSAVSSHGRLIVPMTRVGHSNYENDPTGSSGNAGNNNDAWVCRHAERNTNVARPSYSAGSTIQLQWAFSAKHVGDCDAYISYDVDAARSQMRWFKIANFFDCRADSDRGIDHPLTLPTILKSGNAVLRWGWYALHQHPNVEFYSQCADITITGGQAQLDSQVQTYTLIGAQPIFPLNNANGVGYPNRFPPVEEWMTGPPCAYGIPNDMNECSRTAKGTQGYIDVGQSTDTTGSPTTTTTASSGGTTTTSAVYTDSTVRCGSSWLDADSKCGMPCVNNAECTVAGETCWADLTTCAEVGVTNSCSKWIKISNRPSIPNGWCQTTCTTAATQRYCDSDACECAEIVLPNGDKFIRQEDFAPVLMTIFGIFVSLVHF